MAIERDSKDFKISSSVQAQARNNRSIYEPRPLGRDSDDPMEISALKGQIAANHTFPGSEASGNRSGKRKLQMNEFDMWKYSYSLVKNGYSILAPEPSQRSRSYRDLILQEMNWMAVDYYQERRWKSHIAKEISNSINTTIIDRKRLKRDWPAKQCSYNVEVFWMKVKENGETSPISMGLHEYCQRVVSGKNLSFNSPDFVEEVPTQRNDLLAITVPVYRNFNTNAVNIAKNEVFNATLNHMLVLGAELYPQAHRPPDDEIDVFTLPALNPSHEFDYNTLLLLLHSLKGNMFNMMSKQEHHSLLSSLAAGRNYQTEGRGTMPPIRRIPRDEVDPFSLSVNYRDYLENNAQPASHGQKLVLKWEEPTLNEADFELLESWMLRSKCWPLISIALNLRSSSGGLLRRDFTPKMCREAFFKMGKTPRGQVNTTKKLLGPKQNKTILSFIDAPPPNFRFKLIVPPATSEDGSGGSEPVTVKQDPKEPAMKTLFGDVTRLYKDESKLYSLTVISARQKEGLFGRFKFTSDAKPDKRLLLKEIHTQKPDAFVVPNNLKVEVLTTNPKLKLPIELEEFLSYDGNMELFNRKNRGSQKRTAEETGMGEYSHSTSKPKFQAYSNHQYGVAHRYSALNSVVTLATSVNSHDNVVRNVGYSELSTRMNKQLRIGFLGIPTKMFVYSLFYCGRIKRDFKVRRVAFSISSISKFVPPPHLLYGKMFDPDINLILTKRPSTYDKQRAKITESQEAFTTELLQNYCNEVSTFTNSKADETNIPALLAMYTQVGLSKGQKCNQSCFSDHKILLSQTQSSSSANTNSSSTPTERKRTQMNSIETTPRQKARQIVEITSPPENPPSYRTRQDALMRRQLVQSQNMHQMYPYQQMPMMYCMNPPMSQPMTPMNHPMGNMGQPMGVMNNMNQPMNNMNIMGQPINNMGQPMNNMNQMMNGKVMYNMQSAPIPHYPEDDTY